MQAESMGTRAALRKRMRIFRNQLSPTERKQASQHITQQLSSHPDLLRANTLALYLTNDSEIDLALLIRKLWRTRKRIYLPVIDAMGRNRMRFAQYTPHTRLKPNRFGILEPSLRRNYLPAWALKLVLVPLVAFDAQGGRLGMGGGFYDRTFAFLRWRESRCKLMGVAYDFQRVESLPTESWDLPLPEVVTDKGRYLSRN